MLSEVGVELLRNSIEHGLEIELDRIMTHKERLGRIDVELFERDDKLCLSVRDDGKGLDFSRIRSAAIKLGWVDPRDTNLDRSVLVRGIFENNMSTANVQSSADLKPEDLRGEGLSLVKKSLKSSGGKISVRSVDGQYCQFTIKLPKP